MVKKKPGKKSGEVVVKPDTGEQKKAGRSESPVCRKAMPAVLRFLIAILFLMVFAGFFTWYILQQQYSLVKVSEWQEAITAESFMRGEPILAAYSYTIILLVMCVIAAITWRPFLTIGISFALCSILMYINTQKFTYRDMPLLPEDFLMAGETEAIAQFVDPWSILRLASGAVLVVVGAGILEHVVRKAFGPFLKHKTWLERYSLVPRLAWTTIALAGLLVFARPILRYDDKNNHMDNSWITGLSFGRWNQKGDYMMNGFILSFLYNLGRFQETEPEGYSKEAIAKIEAQHNTEENGKSLDQVVDNVIVVLNESFIDPEILGDVYRHTGGDVVPNLHAIFEKYPSGYMYSPEYGGGTANIEFAVLTGLSNYWAQTVPYVTALPKLGTIPGIAENAKKVNLPGTAVHAYDGSMYKRDVVYRQMGIETFLDIESMEHAEQENGVGYVSDQETYAEALDVLKDEDGKHMVMIATMQNHMPYDAAKYDYYRFKQLNPTDNTYLFESYLETVSHADQYLGEFIAELDKLEERTVMLWFGDHAPAVLNEYTESGDPELIDLAHLTPYFVYANFDLDELYSEKEVADMNEARGFSFEVDGVDLPVVTPNCLSSILYDVLGVKKTPLIALASEVCEEAPILAPVYSKSKQIKDSEVLSDYHLVNYDILSGKGYWLGM